MIVEYDEKGKYYTDVISKDVVFAHIQTHTIKSTVLCMCVRVND